MLLHQMFLELTTFSNEVQKSNLAKVSLPRSTGRKKALL
jgi:hypothetical protein